MNLRLRFVISLATVALVGALAGPAAAADTETVAATVSMAAPCLTVSTREIDFGPMQFSSDTPATSIRGLTYQSCSDADETVFAHVTNATDAGGGPATWTPTGSISCLEGSSNRFVLDLLAQERQERSPLISISQAIETVGRNQTGHFNEVGLTAPCSGSVGSGLTMSLSIVFTATF